MLKVVYLGAEWCGPCKKMSPILDQFTKEHPEVLLTKVDVDEDLETAMALEVISIPTIVVMKDNVEINRHRGVLSLPNFKNLVFGTNNE